MSEELKKDAVVVESLPEKVKEKLGTLKKEIDEINNQFFNLSNEAVGVQKELVVLFDRRKTKAEVVQQTLNFAAGKLKLVKRTGYRWKFDGRGAFIGTPVPVPVVPKKVEKEK